MPEIRKKYDREFRDGAVRIVEETNKPTAAPPASPPPGGAGGQMQEGV